MFFTSDTFLEDFVLTHVIFMPSNHLCPTLMAQYPFHKKWYRNKNILETDDVKIIAWSHPEQSLSSKNRQNRNNYFIKP